MSLPLIDPLRMKRYTPSCMFRDLGCYLEISQGESIYTVESVNDTK